jgi:trans-2-enoyl-CoA reductase
VTGRACCPCSPPTAVGMLGMAALVTGDVVVQNGATSAVGTHVIQLAKARGLRTVNVIRHSGRRPDWDATVAMLRSYGADLVTTEARLKQDLAAAGLPLPALALNCVGGSSAAAIAKVLRRVLLPLPPLDSCQQLIMPLSCSADGW